MGTLPSTLSDWSPQTGEAEAYSKCPRAQPTCIQVEERDLRSLPSRPTPPLVPSQQVLSGLCCSLYATLCMHLHASACTAGVQGQATCRFVYLCTDASTQLHTLGHTCVDTRVQACIPVNTEVYSYTLPCRRLQGPGLGMMHPCA